MSPSAGAVVRSARREDAAAIARIYNQAVEERIATFETEPRTPQDVERVLAERGDRYPTVVVERGGEVVAWASAASYRSRPATTRSPSTRCTSIERIEASGWALDA